MRERPLVSRLSYSGSPYLPGIQEAPLPPVDRPGHTRIKSGETCFPDGVDAILLAAAVQCSSVNFSPPHDTLVPGFGTLRILHAYWNMMPFTLPPLLRELNRSLLLCFVLQ